MKTNWIPAVVLLIALNAGVTSHAEEITLPRRSVLSTAYDAMKRNTLRSMRDQKINTKAIAQADAHVVVTDSEVEGVSPLQDGRQSPQLGLKVCVELVDPDGTDTDEFVDPNQFIWQPGQAFRLRVESALPVQLALFVVTPGKQPTALSPDPDFPTTYKTVMPEDPWVSPIIGLEDDLLPEMLSLIAVRADRGILPINGGTVPIIVNVQSTVDVVVETAKSADPNDRLPNAVPVKVDLTDKLIYSKTKELSQQMLKIIYSKTKDPQIQRAQQMLKMHFVAAGEKPRSLESDEASTLALSEHAVGHLQFVFRKHRP